MTATTNAVKTASAAATLKEAEPVKLLRKIGSTEYTVSIYFSRTSKETMQDKILRLVEREVSK